jgi:hypothetical protein
LVLKRSKPSTNLSGGHDGMKNTTSREELVGRFRGIVGFLPDFEKPEFDPGEFVPPQEIEPKLFTMPYARLSDTASEFVKAAYNSGLILTDFDASKWASTSRVKQMMRNAEMLAHATPQTLARLLTVCIRRDRFVEGALLSDFQSRLILRIVRRAADLLAAQERSCSAPP